MQVVMDRLWESLTALDDAIRRQRRALATVGAMRNLSDLEKARGLVKQAHLVLARIEGDALVPPTSPSPQETPQ